MLSSGLSMLCVLSLANIFARSMVVFNIQLYLGLLVFCGFVVFGMLQHHHTLNIHINSHINSHIFTDTQLIVEKAIQGDKDFVSHSLELFIGTFTTLLFLSVPSLPLLLPPPTSHLPPPTSHLPPPTSLALILISCTDFTKIFVRLLIILSKDKKSKKESR